MVNFQDVNGQQHVEQTNLRESAIGAEPVPQPFVDHDFLIDRAVLEDTARIEQPMVKSCLTPYEGEEGNCDQPYLDPIRECRCMSCLFLGTQRGPFLPGSRLERDWEYNFEACRVPTCETRVRAVESYLRATVAKHERAHFGEAGDYHCLEEGCKTITTKFADLRRHCLSRHCTNVTKFPCPMIGCKYGGDNGFTREDKLKSHHRNVHQGKVVPGKALQPIKPKADGAKVIKSKPQGIQTIKAKPSAGA